MPTLGIQSISIEAIRTSGTQSRKQLDSKTVSDLRQDIRDSNPIDPIVLFYDDDDYWIGDGYHRFEAHVKQKREIIQADVRRGTKEEALRFNIESNACADQTRWTNADKRNAVTMLLRSCGETEVTRGRAEEFATLAKCTSRLVYDISKELRSSAEPFSKPTDTSQTTVPQAVTPKSIRDDKDVGHEQKEEPKTEPFKGTPKPAPNGRRSIEKKERDEQVAALAKEGLSQSDIADRLGVSRSTVTHSFHRQKLTPETANPLVKVLERAQIAAAEWESTASSLRDGLGAAALWHTATREQKKEVIGHIKEAIRFQTDFINRLNKEAKG